MSTGHRILSMGLGDIILRLNGTFGASGAVPATPTDNNGFRGTTPMVSSGSGVYVCYLESSMSKLVGEDYIPVRQASYSVDGACYGEVTTDNVAGATPSVTITFRDADGVAVQPSSGDKFKIAITVRR